MFPMQSAAGVEGVPLIRRHGPCRHDAVRGAIAEFDLFQRVALGEYPLANKACGLKVVMEPIAVARRNHVRLEASA